MGVQVCLDDEYYRCLCNTHVHKGTMILAIVGIIFNVPMALSVLNIGQVWYFGVTCAINILSLVTYISLLIGNRREIPFLYYPFLVVNTIILVVMILVAFGLFIGAAFIFSGKTDTKPDEQDALGGFIVGLGIFYIFAALIQVYFFYVVFRGYRYLKDVLLDPTSNLPRFH